MRRHKLIYVAGHDALFVHYPDGTLDEFPCPIDQLEEHIRVLCEDFGDVDLTHARPVRPTLFGTIQMRLAAA